MNKTLDAYNQYAELYDQEVIEFWNNFPPALLDELESHSPGKRLLNVGSGSGRDAVLLRERGFEVVCQDGSESMTQLTKKLGFESHLMDFSQLNFPAGSFDAIWAYTSLIHIPKSEAREIIKNLRLLLRSQGVFVIGVIEGEEAGMVEHSSMPGVERYFKNYTSDELKELIEVLGFRFLAEEKYQPHSKVWLSQLYRLV